MSLSPHAVIRFLNSLFEKSLPLDSSVTYLETETVDDDMKKMIADTVLTVTVPDGTVEKFQIEVQIDNDESIVVRIFRYGLADALKYRTSCDGKITLRLPQPRIIYLEHTAGTPDEAVLEIIFPDEKIHTYKVPTMKLLSYTVEELAKKDMAILLPLYLLKLRKEIGKKPTKENGQALKELIEGKIVKALYESKDAGEINTDDVKTLSALLRKLYDYLYGGIEIFEE